MSQVVALRERIRERVTHLEDLEHVASDLNAADICTRRDASIRDRALNSNWQTGPGWIKEPRFLWPCTREFVRSELPEQETKAPIQIVTVLRASTTKISNNNMVQWVLSTVNTYSHGVIKLARTIKSVSDLRAKVSGHTLTVSPMFKQCVQRAKLLIWELEMSLTDTLLSEGHLHNLHIFSE